MDTEAKNMRAPEDIEDTDFECTNLDDAGLGEDFDAIDADETEDKDLDEDEMENPIRKSDSDDDDDDGEGDEDDDDLDKSDDDDDEDDDEDEDDLKKQAKKGGLTPANLNKSIEALARFAQKADPQARKKELMRRAYMGKSLSQAEKAELMQHLNKSAPHGKAAPSRTLSKGLNGNRAIQQSIDVSEYLAQQHQELCKALNSVEQRLNAMAEQSTEFQLLLAKAVAQTGQGVSRLNKSVGQVQSAPVRGPKSLGVTGRSRPLQKSGLSGDGQAITKGQASDALDALLQKSRVTGRYGKSDSGADLLKAAMHFESSGQLLPEVQPDVRRYLRETH